jgi:hypothetical protein
MRIISIAEPRPYLVPGTAEWDRVYAIPGPFERVRRYVSSRTRRNNTAFVDHK